MLWRDTALRSPASRSGNLFHPQLKPKSFGGVGSTTELGVQREEARSREEDRDEADEVEEGHLAAVLSELSAVDQKERHGHCDRAAEGRQPRERSDDQQAHADDFAEHGQRQAGRVAHAERIGKRGGLLGERHQLGPAVRDEHLRPEGDSQQQDRAVGFGRDEIKLKSADEEVHRLIFLLVATLVSNDIGLAIHAQRESVTQEHAEREHQQGEWLELMHVGEEERKTLVRDERRESPFGVEAEGESREGAHDRERRRATACKVARRQTQQRGREDECVEALSRGPEEGEVTDASPEGRAEQPECDRPWSAGFIHGGTCFYERSVPHSLS